MNQRVAWFLGCVLAVACAYEKAQDDTLQIELIDTPDSVSGGSGGVSGGGTGGEPVAAATGGVGGAYKAGTAVSYGVTRETGRFYADGVSFRTVRVSFIGRATAGKPLTVTTSLGIINPAAEVAGRRTLQLKTSNGSALEFPLYAERTPGAGRLTVEGPNGTRDTDDFYLEPLTEQLAIGRAAGYYTADGNQTITLSIGLTSPDESFRKVTVRTTHGTLSPDKKDELARAREIQVSPKQPTQLEWALGKIAGTAVLTAEFDAVAAPPNTVVIEPVSIDQPTLTVKPNPATTEVFADGATSVPINITYNAPGDQSDTVTLTTTLGVLNPAGTSPEARRTTTVSVHGGKTSTVNLGVGQTSGRAVITARASSTSDVAESLHLGTAQPETLTLETADGTVFDTTRRQLGVNVRVARNPDNGRVSEGTTVELLTCCLRGGTEVSGGAGGGAGGGGAGGGAGGGPSLGECAENLVSGPSFLSDDNGDGREVATLSLTPAGKVFVDGVATTMVERRNVTFYAYVRDPAAALQDCGSIKEAVKPGVLASKSIELALEQKPPVPAKTP